MYYVKIPLRYLCEPHELNVPEEQRGEVWAKRVLSLLDDLKQGVLPAWAVDSNDLRQLVLLNQAGQEVATNAN